MSVLSSVENKIRTRSVTRLILPFSFSQYFMDYQERENIPLHKFMRETLKISPDNIKSYCNTKFPIYNFLFNTLKNSNSWNLLEEGMQTNYKSVLLPQLVSILLSPKNNPTNKKGYPPEISIFRMENECRKKSFGDFLFTTKSKDQINFKKKKKRNSQSNDGFFCLLSDIRLIVSSTGVAVIQLDLHLCNIGEADKPLVNKEFKKKLMDFVSLCQYFPSKQRKEISPIFVRNHPMILTSLDPSLEVFKIDYLKKMLNEFTDYFKKEINNKKQTLIEQHGTATDKAFNHMIGEAKRNISEDKANFFKIFEENISNPTLSNEDIDQKIKWLENPIKDELTREQVNVLRPKIQQELILMMKQIPDWIKKKNKPESQKNETNTECNRTWEYDSLVKYIFKTMNPPNDADTNNDSAEDNKISFNSDDADRLFLNGDRMFIYNHVLLDPEEKITDDNNEAFAYRLSRRHNTNYALVPMQNKNEIISTYQPFETIYYNIALEGIAVLQATGDNSMFDKDSSILRERHFLLILIALLYRYNLLNIVFQSVINEENIEDESEQVEKLNSRIEHFTHHIYHSHISNITHLQNLFVVLFKQMDIKLLWEDTDRDIAQYLERKRMFIERQKEQRRKKFGIFITIIASLIAFKDILELLSKLESTKLIVKWLGSSGGTLLILLTLFFVLCFSVRQVIVKTREEPID